MRTTSSDRDEVYHYMPLKAAIRLVAFAFVAGMVIGGAIVAVVLTASR